MKELQKGDIYSATIKSHKPQFQVLICLKELQKTTQKTLDSQFQDQDITLQHPVALYRSDIGVLCRPSAMSFTILSSYSFIGPYMFRPNWSSSGVQIVTVEHSAAHCNVVFFPPVHLKMVSSAITCTLQ
jgi:hypothetical protein